MKIVKVTYTVQSSFVQQNQENIRTFLNDVRNLTGSDIRYHVYLGNDGKTFTHFAIYENESAQKILLELPSFKLFQNKRDASGLEKEPTIEAMEFVAASYDIFN